MRGSESRFGLGFIESNVNFDSRFLIFFNSPTSQRTEGISMSILFEEIIGVKVQMYGHCFIVKVVYNRLPVNSLINIAFCVDI